MRPSKASPVFRMPLILWITLIVAVYASVALGVGSAYVWQDIATFFGPASQPYTICFGVYASDDVSTSPGMPNWVQLRWTREEDLSQGYAQYFRTQWIKASLASQGQTYCTPNQLVPRQGHYSYELRMCPTLPADPSMIGSCSAWISSKDISVASLNGTPRAWWVYGYADPSPPSATTVTP